MKAMTVILAVLAVYIPNQLHFPDSLGIKGLNVFNLLLVVALTMLLVSRNSAGRETAERAPLGRVLMFYYAVLGFALVAGIAWGSPHPMADVTVYKSIVTYSLLYIVTYYGVRELRDVRWLLAVVVFVFAVAGIEAVREGLDYGFGNYAHSKRAAGPFSADSSNANFAGVFYSIFASFSLALALYARTFPKWARLGAAVAFGLGVVAVLATFSRQSFLILGVTILLITLRKNLLLGAIAAVVILNYPLWAPEGVIERVEMTQQQGEYGETVLEDSAESRYVLWTAAADIIGDHPEGIGLNQFKRIVDPYMPSWILARDAQNQYLLIAAEAGILGLLAFLTLLVALLRQGILLSRHPSPPEAGAVGAAFAIAVVAVMMGNIYSSTFHFGEVMGNFWILAGIVSRYRMLGAQTVIEPENQAESTPLEQARKVYARWHDRAT